MSTKPESFEKGTTRGYAVEMRSIASHPEAFRGMLLDERWQRVPMNLMPECRADFLLNRVELANYADAESFRWKMHSYFLSSICIETRIVEFEITYSFEATRIAEHKVLRMRETGKP